MELIEKKGNKQSAVGDKDLLDVIEESLKPVREVWKIYYWDDYLYHNLPFWLYFNWKKRFKSMINWIQYQILKKRKSGAS